MFSVLLLYASFLHHWVPSEESITGKVISSLDGCSIYPDWKENKKDITIGCGSGEVLAGWGKCEYGSPSKSRNISSTKWKFECSKSSKGKKIYGWVVCCPGNLIPQITGETLVISENTKVNVKVSDENEEADSTTSLSPVQNCYASKYSYKLSTILSENGGCDNSENYYFATQDQIRSVCGFGKAYSKTYGTSKTVTSDIYALVSGKTRAKYASDLVKVKCDPNTKIATVKELTKAEKDLTSKSLHYAWCCK